MNTLFPEYSQLPEVSDGLDLRVSDMGLETQWVEFAQDWPTWLEDACMADDAMIGVFEDFDESTSDLEAEAEL